MNHKQIPNASELELFEGSRVYLEHHNNPSKGSKTPYFTFSSIIEAEQEEEKGLLTHSFVYHGEGMLSNCL